MNRENIKELVNRYAAANVTLWTEDGKLKFKAPANVMTAEMKNELKTLKEDIIAYLETKDNVEHDEEHRYEPFPLTDIQAAYLVGRTGDYGYGNVGCKVYIEMTAADIEYDRLQSAWETVISRHDMLHTMISKSGTQCTEKEYKMPVTALYDLRDMDSTSAQKKAEEVRREMSCKQYGAESFPLYDLALVRFTDKDIICIAVDMLIADFTSITIMVNELEKFYYGTETPEPLTVTFRDIMINRENNKDNKKFNAAKKYWLDRLDTIPEAPSMPVEDNSDSISVDFEQHNYVLSYDKWDKILAKAKENGLTATSVVLNAYADVISIWSGQEKFSLNVTMAHRDDKCAEIGSIVGDFTVVDLLEVDHSRKASFNEQAMKIQKQLWSDMENADFSGVAVMRELKRLKERDVLFPVVFTSTLGFKDETIRTSDKKFVLTYKISQTPQVLIDCQISEEKDGILINWDVRRDAFPNGLISSAFSEFTAILDRLVDNDSAWESVSAYKLSDNQAEVRRRVNDTAGDVPTGLMYDGFITNVSKTPDKTAVIFKDKEYSYRQLALCAEAVKQSLISKGFTKGSTSAVDLEKGVWQIAAVLGIMLAGGSYLPLDADQPSDRKDEIIAESCTKWAVSDSNCGITADITKINVDELSPADEITEAVRVSETDMAYVIYTSGSTGKPKGVMISHRSALNTIVDINQRFGITASDSVEALANLAFDLSVYDIFGMLAAGGTIVIPEHIKRKDPQYWESLISKYNITVWNSVPAQMQILLTYIASMKEKHSYAMRVVMLSGDWIPVSQPSAIYNTFDGCTLYSLGGATEAAIWSIYYEAGRDEKFVKSVPYGYPLKNQYFKVLSSALEDCPDYVTGDLYIGGVGVTMGYMNDPEITAEKLIKDPATGETLYFTGDLGRYLENGVIEFIGRSDDQVKIHGHRIEIKEIESSLESIDGVDSAVVVIDENGGRDKSLAGFVQLEKRRDIHKTLVPTEKLRADVITAGDEGTKDIDRELFAEWTRTAADTALYDILSCLRENGMFGDDEKYSISDVQEKLHAGSERLELLYRWITTLHREGILGYDEASEKYYLADKTINEDTREASWKKWWSIENKMHYGKELVGYFEESGRHLTQLMSGEMDALELFFPKGDNTIAMAAYHDNLISSSLNKVMIGAVHSVIRQAGDKLGRPVRILEIGAGVGGASLDVIPSLKGMNAEYVFTDVSNYFLNAAQKNFADCDFVEYALFDINKPYWEQGVSADEFDIIICNNVLHNAKSLPKVMQSFREILTEGGVIIIADTTGENYSLLTSMEFHSGLNQFEDFRKEDNQVFVKKEQWLKVFENEDIELATVYPADEDPLSEAKQAVFVGQFVSSVPDITEDEIKEKLGEKVPAYMIPKYMEILSALPLTRNGKIDRGLLAGRLEYTGQTAAFTGTETNSGLEKSIEKIWAQALHRDSIWRDENFYQAGGDSLLLAKVVSDMKELPEFSSLEWDEIMTEIIKTPTIAEMAEKAGNGAGSASDGDSSAAEDPMLIFDKKESSDSCIVLFHDGTGTLSPYDELVPYLRDDAKRTEWLIGFRYGDEEKYLSHTPENLLRELGMDYAERLMKLGLKKYILIGYCMGGLVAVETAKCLIEAGMDVEPVITIDTTPADPRLRNDLLMERTFGLLIGADLTEEIGHYADESLLKKALLELLDKNSGNITEADLCGLSGEFAPLGESFTKLSKKTAEERFSDICSHINRLNSALISEYQQKKLEGLYKLFYLNFSAMSLYGQEFFTGDVAALNCSDKFSNFLPVLGTRNSEFWHEVTLGQLEMTEIDGNHLSCMHEPKVKNVADFIRDFCEVRRNEKA